MTVVQTQIDFAMAKNIVHQFGLFGFCVPVGKVPISAERIREAKALFLKGDQKLSAAKLREIRESLEDFERRIK